MPSRRDIARALAIAGILIVILIAIVVATFNGCYVISCDPKVVVEKATLIKISDNQYILIISVRELFGGSTTIIQRVVLTGDGLDGEQQCHLKSGQDIALHAGESKSLVYQCDLQLCPGITYYVRVYYQKGEGSEATDLYPVTMR